MAAKSFPYSGFNVTLCDGSKAVGFQVVDPTNYHRYKPCSHIEGIAVSCLSSSKEIHYAPLVSTYNGYPQTYNILISTRQQSAGAC